MPEPLSRPRIERDQAVREEVFAEPIASIEVVGRRSGRHVHDAALVINREGAPVVGTADVLVRLLRPRVVAELSRPRDCMELPDLPAGDDVVGADISGWGDERLARGGPKDQQVLPDLARAVVVPAHLLAAREIGAQIDGPIDAEGRDGATGARIDRLEEVVDREQQPPVFAVVALPVVDAAAGHPVQPFVDPDFLARGGVERDE